MEDFPGAQGVLVALLEDAGAEVTAVATAAEAFVAIRRTRPDVAICDLGLGDPNEGGHALI